MSSLFQNVTQSKQYAAFRPTYPTAVYRRIVQALEKTKHGGLGVDVGCGSGQATLGLARAVAAAAAAASTTTASASSNANTTSSPHPVLERIVGIDPSPAQVQQARHKLETGFLQVDKEISQDKTTTRLLPGVEFHPGHDHDIVKTLQGLHLHIHPQHPVTCIIAAQAAHWFDMPAFYQQVDQLLAPGGVLALWTYGNLQLHSEKDATNADAVQELQQKIMVELYEQILGDTYWDPRRRHAETLYRELPQIQTVLRSNNRYTTEYITSNANNPDPDFFIRQTMTRPQLMGYLRSWSGYISYLQHHQISSGSTEDPVAQIDTWIANAQCATTGTPALPDVFQVEWPIAMLLSVKQ